MDEAPRSAWHIDAGAQHVNGAQAVIEATFAYHLLPNMGAGSTPWPNLEHRTEGRRADAAGSDSDRSCWLHESYETGTLLFGIEEVSCLILSTEL